MKQLTQKLRNGEMQILEVPIPHLQKGQILVRNFYSVISAGTEASSVKAARKGYIGKAKDRPHQMKQVVDTLKSQGITQTYRAVMKKLDAYSPLGYSCVGEIIDMAPDVVGYKLGDLVACGGLTASHAEVVSVPTNLCVTLKNSLDLKQAAYNTLGAIAMQGVRQADLRLGETCAIIGLGLLGQLTGLLLKASGVRVVGVDIDRNIVKIAEGHCLDLALQRDDVAIENRILEFTGGLGCDAVIITAASTSTDPINFAGAISRKKGTVVVVGDVPTGFEREPHFYQKEIQVKMSCSYGPGRYDPQYEEKGIDYPPAYVRWTENRNMQAFQELIHNKKIDMSYLTTHTFKLEDAPAAYDLVLARSEPFLGILIEYDVDKEIQSQRVQIGSRPPTSNLKPQTVNIGFIGAGSYAQSHLLPNITKNKRVSLKGVMTTTGTSSRSVADRFGFEFCTSNEKDILENESINTIFIATRHDSHGPYVLKALEAGKNVFVEKPLCLTLQQLEEITELVAQGTRRKAQGILMVGYNRRFSPLTQAIKREFGEGPMAINYRINAGKIPPESWIQDREIGGDRIIGEVCHFVDLLTCINGSLPVSVYATAMMDAPKLNDILNISLTYENGSIANISYFSNGDKSIPKERIEIFKNGATAILDDFRKITIYTDGKKKTKRLYSQDKGQKHQIDNFINSILGEESESIHFQEIYTTSLATFNILESLHVGQCVKIHRST